MSAASVAVLELFESDPAAQALAIEVVEVEEGRVVLVMTPPASAGNAHGIVHGGTIFALADTAFAYAFASHGILGVTTTATISFLSAAAVGSPLRATANEFFFDGTTGIFDVAVTSRSGDVLAAFRGQGRVRRAST